MSRDLRLDPALTQIADSAFVARNATVIGDVHIAEEANVWFGAIIRGDTEEIRIGKRTNVQDGSVMHADPGYACTLGDDVTVGHKAIVHGATVGNRVMVGMGAIVMNGAKIGDDSIIGAGALVKEHADIPSRSLVLGVPGKVVRELSEPEVQMLQMSAQHYVESGQAYKEEGYGR